MATYEPKFNCCRKRGCWVCRGVDYLHGPYWYAYWRDWITEPGRAERQRKRQRKTGDYRGRYTHDTHKGPTRSLYIGRAPWPGLGDEAVGDPPAAKPAGWKNAPRIEDESRMVQEMQKKRLQAYSTEQRRGLMRHQLRTAAQYRKLREQRLQWEAEDRAEAQAEHQEKRKRAARAAKRKKR